MIYLLIYRNVFCNIQFKFSGAGLLQHYIKSGKSEKEIKKTIYQFCVSLKIQSNRVCEGITELFAGEVIYVLRKLKIGIKIHHEILSYFKLIKNYAGPDEICSFVIGDACGDVYNPYHEWEVMFPPVPKPAIIEQKKAMVISFKKQQNTRIFMLVYFIGPSAHV